MRKGWQLMWIFYFSILVVENNKKLTETVIELPLLELTGRKNKILAII